MKYCYECGEKLTTKECYNHGVFDGVFPYCPKCAEFRFPFFNVAVSAVIFNKDFSKTLLIKQYGRDINILTAGYVNKKETLEDALKREILEETGLKIEYFRFNESRYYEKSNSLICNFNVMAKNENFVLNQEVDSAKWYDIKEAKLAVHKNSLAECFLNLAVEKIPQLYQETHNKGADYFFSSAS